jgi:hypothetical protein
VQESSSTMPPFRGSEKALIEGRGTTIRTLKAKETLSKHDLIMEQFKVNKAKFNRGKR